MFLHLYGLILKTFPVLPWESSHSFSARSLDSSESRSCLFSFSNFQPSTHNLGHLQCGRVHPVHPHSYSHIHSRTQLVHETLVLIFFSLTLLSLRLASNVFLADFPSRWRQLIEFSEEAEAKCSQFPSHLFESVVAYEDRRFFKHFGIDPVGIGHAMLYFSARGGGSTITQQLVKNTLLKNRRTFSRKIVEMVLALALERTLSKSRILSSYLCKIYWGHGLYGIEASSKFYFGKHPTLLNLGESALLAGIIPAPDLRSPLRNASRGKSFQARVLKRMVEVGVIDIGTAHTTVKQSLQLHVHMADCQGKVVQHSTLKEIWDWERESKMWEASEEIEIWMVSMKGREKK